MDIALSVRNARALARRASSIMLWSERWSPMAMAAIAGFGGPRLDPARIPAAGSHALQRPVKQRGRLQDAVADAKRRLPDPIRWASPTPERVLPDLRTRLSLTLLQRWVDPDVVLSARKAAITRNASGNHTHGGPFVETRVDGLRQAARHARASMAAMMTGSSCRLARRRLRKRPG